VGGDRATRSRSRWRERQSNAKAARLNGRTCIPLAAFKKSRVAKMGQFGRWNLHKREAQGLSLHGSAGTCCFSCRIRRYHFNGAIIPIPIYAWKRRALNVFKAAYTYKAQGDEPNGVSAIIMSLAPKPASTALALPNVTASTATMLSDLTKALGVERKILPSDDQIAHVWGNLPRLIEKIPAEHRSETIVRMCIAVASGLFDGAINYAWNAAVIELRNKVRRFGLAVVPQVIDKDFDEATLLDLKDAELLDLCLKLNLITEDGFFLLDQNRDIRNNFSAAHPTMGAIDEYEFLNFFSRCGNHALTNEKNPRGVDIQAFIAAIKTAGFTNEQRDLWISRLSDTFDAQREALFGMLHGIYCDPASGEQSRVNSLSVCDPFKATLSPKTKSELIDRHQDYKAKGDEKRSKASSQFFEKLGLLSLLGDTELHAIFTTASSNLLAVHNGMNNFYNEPPFAQRLAQISTENPIPASAQYSVVEAVTTCATGNPWGISNAAMPWYEKMIKSFSPSEIAIMLNFGSLPQTVVGNRIKSSTACRKRFSHLATLIAPTSVPTSSKSQYDFWIKVATTP
jgi:hypothetical protein